MRANIQKVLTAFSEGRAAKGDAKNTCSTDGQVIYSYRLALAHRDAAGNVFMRLTRREAIDAAKQFSKTGATTRAQYDAVANFVEAYDHDAHVRDVAREALKIASAA